MDAKVYAPGTRVGASRWPYSGHHTDGWQPPHAGTVLAQDDPRAWAGTLEFPEAMPDHGRVSAHVASCRLRGILSERTPVAWDFGRVYWESDVRPYAEDVAAWELARATQRATEYGFRWVKNGTRGYATA